MAMVVYALCLLTCLGCALLLLRHYRSGRTSLLLWSSLAFVGLALNNVALLVDYLVPTIDLSILRTATALASVGLLLFGLVWHSGAPRE